MGAFCLKELMLKYENKYGTLELEIVSDYQNVSSIHSKNLSPDLFFNITTAEKIALISGNEDIQLSVTFDAKKMFVIHHKSSNVAAVCRVKSINYTYDVTPQLELARPNPYGQIYH